MRSGVKRALISIAVIAAVLAWPTYAAWRNYHGYCAKLGRYLTDQEFIDAAIDRVIRSNNARPIKPIDPNTIAYRDRESFLRVNPECCQREGRFLVNGYPDEGPNQVTFMGRATGYEFTWVAVRYTERNVYSDGRREDQSMKRYISMDGCGVNR